MRRRILPMAMEQTNRAPKKEAIWYQNSLTSTTRGWRGLPLVKRGSCLGGNYNGLQMIDWLMATAPGQRITFLRPNSGTQLNAMMPQTPLPDQHPPLRNLHLQVLSASCNKNALLQIKS